MVSRQLALVCAFLFHQILYCVPAAVPGVPAGESFWVRHVAPKVSAAKDFAVQNPWTSVGIAAASVTAVSVLNKKRNCKRLIAELQAIKDQIISDQKSGNGKRVPLIANHEYRKHIVLGLDPADYGMNNADYEQLVKFLGMYDDSENSRSKKLKDKERTLNLLVLAQSRKYASQLKTLEDIERQQGNNSHEHTIQLTMEQRDTFLRVMHSLYGTQKLDALVGFFTGNAVSRDYFERTLVTMKQILLANIGALTDATPVDRCFDEIKKNPELYGVSAELCDEIEALKSEMEVRNKLTELLDKLDNQIRFKNNELNSDVVSKTAAAASIGVAGYGIQKAWEWWNNPSAVRPQMTWASTAFRWIARTMENHPKITTAIAAGVGALLLGAWWIKRKFGNTSPAPDKLPPVIRDAPRPPEPSNVPPVSTPVAANNIAGSQNGGSVLDIQQEMKNDQLDHKHSSPYEHHVIIDDTGRPDPVVD